MQLNSFLIICTGQCRRSTRYTLQPSCWMPPVTPPGGSRILEFGTGTRLLCDPQRKFHHCLAGACPRHWRLAHCCQPFRLPHLAHQEHQRERCGLHQAERGRLRRNDYVHLAGRPLSAAGRVLVRDEAAGTLESRLVDLDRDLLVIPSLAIHMDRTLNSGHAFNPQVDMQPLYGWRFQALPRPAG